MVLLSTREPHLLVTSVEGIWKTAVAAIRAPLLKDIHGFRRLVAKLQCIQSIVVDSALPLSTEMLQSLLNMIEKYFMLSLEEKVRESTPSDDDEVHLVKKRQQLVDALAYWKSAKPRMHLIRLCTGDDEDQVATTSFEIASHMAQVWKDKLKLPVDYFDIFLTLFGLIFLFPPRRHSYRS